MCTVWGLVSTRRTLLTFRCSVTQVRVADVDTPSTPTMPSSRLSRMRYGQHVPHTQKPDTSVKLDRAETQPAHTGGAAVKNSPLLCYLATNDSDMRRHQQSVLS